MVKDIPIFRPRANLPPADADGAYRILVSQQPRADVEVVDVLLDVEVARQPCEVVPVAHLPVHVGPVGLTGMEPNSAAIVVGLQGVNLAQFAGMNPADEFPKADRVPQAKSGHDRKTFAPRHFA